MDSFIEQLPVDVQVSLYTFWACNDGGLDEGEEGDFALILHDCCHAILGMGISLEEEATLLRLQNSFSQKEIQLTAYEQSLVQVLPVELYPLFAQYPI